MAEDRAAAQHTRLMAKAKQWRQLDETRRRAAQPPAFQLALLAASTFAVMGSAVLIPFRQGRNDDLGCTKLCLGAMTSTKSSLQLLGSPAIGRFSDAVGRKPAFGLACVGNVLSLLVFAWTDSVAGLFLSQVPQALLSDLFGVAKAVVADHTPADDTVRAPLQSAPPPIPHRPRDCRWSDRASDRSQERRSALLGRLGAATGVGLMLGPAFGGMLLADHYQACAFGVCANVLVFCAVSFLPPAPHLAAAEASPTPSASDGGGGGVQARVRAVWENLCLIWALARDSSAAVRLLLALRFCLTLGFHVYNVAFMPSLRARFDMGPKDFGKFMGLVVRLFPTSLFVLGAQVLCCPSDRTGRLLHRAWCMPSASSRWLSP